MKKGFTLIELLAVIVILAIIALIAVPVVLNIINDAKESSVLRSAEFYLDGIEYTVANAFLYHGGLSDGTYPITEDGDICKTNLPCDSLNILKVDVNGEKPEGGSVTIENGNISDVSLVLSDNTITKNKDGELVYLTLDALCTYDSSSKAEKTVGAKYTCDFGGGDRNFYILELGTNPVTNTKLKEGEVALILEGNYDMTTHAWCDQNGSNPSSNTCNADGLTPKLNEIASDWKKLNRMQIVLPSAEQIVVADGKEEDGYRSLPMLSNEWLYNWPNFIEYEDGDLNIDGYWTATYRDDVTTGAWFVSNAGGC